MPLTHQLDHAVATFSGLRPRLFGIAYRMLGRAAEAEDVVQEVWLRWQGTDRSLVRDPAGFLATTTTRLALNVAQSARSRRETYVGQWLPEPVDTRDDPALGAERSEALELAVLLLLEKLRPKERAVYLEQHPELRFGNRGAGHRAGRPAVEEHGVHGNLPRRQGAGYSDQPHLSRDFRELAGISPARYRVLAPEHDHHVPVTARSISYKTQRMR